MTEPITQLLAKLDNDPHARDCFNDADYFTAVRGCSPLNRQKVRRSKLSAAVRAGRLMADRLDGKGDGRSMIYVVSKAGLTGHLFNV